MTTAQLSDRPNVQTVDLYCSVPGCTDLAKCRQMCWNCYQGWWRKNRTEIPDIVIPEVGSLSEARWEARQLSQKRYNRTEKFRLSQAQYLKSRKGKASLRRKRRREANRRRILSFLNRACPSAISQVLPLTIEQAQLIVRQREAIDWELLSRLFPQSVIDQLRNFPFSPKKAKAARRLDRQLRQ